MRMKRGCRRRLMWKNGKERKLMDGTSRGEPRRYGGRERGKESEDDGRMMDK